MDKATFNKKVIAPLTAWSHLGEETSEIGSRLIGHVPHIAPIAYLHVVFPPLNSENMHELNEKLGRPIPEQFKQFLRLSNGLDIFATSISIIGYVPSIRKVKMHPYNYALDILVDNVISRNKGLRHNAVVIAFYKHDGSYASIEEDGTVERYDTQNDGRIIQTWPDFDTWLISEIAYLSEYFDKDGKMLAKPEEIFKAH